MLSFLFLIVTYGICALTFVVSKFSLSTLPILFYLLLRSFLAGVFFYFMGGGFSFSQFLNTNKYGFISLIYCLYFLCDLFSLSGMSSSMSAMIYALSPLVTAFLSGEKIGLLSLFGILVAISGSILFSSFGCLSFNHNPLSVLLCFSAMILGSYFWISLKKNHLQENFFKINTVINLRMMIVAFSLLFIQILIQPQKLSFIFDITTLKLGVFFSHCAIIVFLSNFLFSYLYQKSLCFFSATTVCMAGVFCPLYVALLSYTFLDETIDWWLFLKSFVLCIFGISIFLFGRRTYTKKKEIRSES